jgi:hypothetical protein
MAKFVGPRTYALCMATIQTVSRKQLRARRAAILRELGVTDDELLEKVRMGGLVGAEWSLWAEIEEIDYLLTRD